MEIRTVTREYGDNGEAEISVESRRGQIIENKSEQRAQTEQRV